MASGLCAVAPSTNPVEVMMIPESPTVAAWAILFSRLDTPMNIPSRRSPLSNSSASQIGKDGIEEHDEDGNAEARENVGDSQGNFGVKRIQELRPPMKITARPAPHSSVIISAEFQAKRIEGDRRRSNSG